jgi:hypothetical protein
VVRQEDSEVEVVRRVDLEVEELELSAADPYPNDGRVLDVEYSDLRTVRRPVSC